MGEKKQGSHTRNRSLVALLSTFCMLSSAPWLKSPIAGILKAPKDLCLMQTTDTKEVAAHVLLSSTPLDEKQRQSQSMHM